MMRVTVLAVGRLRPAFREAADEYLRRLRRYGETLEIEVREAGKAPSAAESLRLEGERLKAKVPPGHTWLPWTGKGRAGPARWPPSASATGETRGDRW